MIEISKDMRSGFEMIGSVLHLKLHKHLLSSKFRNKLRTGKQFAGNPPFPSSSFIPGAAILTLSHDNTAATLTLTFITSRVQTKNYIADQYVWWREVLKMFISLIS